MKHLKETIERYFEKELEIEIDDEIKSISIIDWEEILAKNAEWEKGMEGMTDEQKNDYCNHAVSDLVNIYTYFLDEEEFVEKVENKEWIPFAVLGMYKPHIYGYAEMNNGGILLFNIEEDEENPPIIFIADGEEQTIAENFDTLKIENVK